LERSDGNLACVLPEQPLTATETREMLDAAVEALAYLHERGFVHSAFQPANIVAVGEEIKLSSDCIVRASEIEGASSANDVWSLGMTVVESLTQRAPDLNPIDNAPVIPDNLPQPFLEIVRNCLRPDPNLRWTVSQIAARLRAPRVSIMPSGPRSRMPRAYL